MKTKLKNATIIIFIATELVLYALFLAEDFGEVNVGINVALKYATVALAFLFALAVFAFLKRGDNKGLLDSILLAVGLCLTLVSDLFLLVIGKYFEAGLVTFIGAQLCYFALIRRTKLWLVISVALRVSLPIVAIVVLATTFEINALYALVAIYFVQLVMNFAENVAVAIVAKDKTERIVGVVLALGFLLFIGCDICVGLLNLNGEVGELIWLFYTPSQVLIALSNRRIYENQTH